MVASCMMQSPILAGRVMVNLAVNSVYHIADLNLELQISLHQSGCKGRDLDGHGRAAAFAPRGDITPAFTCDQSMGLTSLLYDKGSD